MLRVVYPRVIFRTSRAAGVCLILAFTMSLTAVALVAARWTRPLGDLVVLGVFVAMPCLLAFRILRHLAELERRQSEPDDTMVLLFDLSMMLPVVSLAVAVFAMRAVH
jgi:hypothetical protein